MSIACEGTSTYDCKLGTCHGLPQCGTCCKCLGQCYIEMNGAKIVEEFELKEPEKPEPGTTIYVKNEDMIKPWINSVVMVTFPGLAPVPAKVLEVNENSTKIVILKEAPKA